MVLRELSVLGESAVQLVGSVPMEQKVHLAQAQPVPQVRLAALECSVELGRLALSVQVLLEH